MATFAGVCAGEAQVFLCKDGQGLRGGKPARFDGDDDTGAMWMSIWLKKPQDVDEAHQKALAAGMNDHIAKPIDVAAMFDTLSRWMRGAG